MSSRALRAALALMCLCLLAVGCGAPEVVVATPPPPMAVRMVPIAPAVQETNPPEIEENVADDPDGGPVPVSSADPSWGRRDAPVTIVEWADFQCPFSQRAVATLADLRRNYGPDRLRIVWKNNPLPFHPQAVPSALVAMSLMERQGKKAFWDAHDAFYGDQRRLKEVADEVTARLGTSVEELRASASWGRAEAKLQADIELGKAVGATGTPIFFINGVHLSGAQPYEKFASIIDEQLGKARDLVGRGVPPRRVYAELAKVQWQAAPPPAPRPPDVPSFQRVALGKSPVRGKATALVTIVEWADFECPYSKRVTPTLAQVSREYGDKVRFVFKQNPLPFHRHAAAAAELALEAQAQKGDRGFWAAYDLLYKFECLGAKATDKSTCESQNGTWVEPQAHLEDADLLVYAKTLGLDANRVQAALAGRKHQAVIDEDQRQAADLKASGTPTFFINGRLFVGAQPIDKFRTVIDEELAKAQALVKSGVPVTKIYDKIMAGVAAPAIAAPTEVGAKHLVVMYAGSKRASGSVTRTKEEARVLAQEALRRLRAGANFAEVVKQFSDEQGSASRGGDLGTFKPEVMVPAFAKAVVALKVGEISNVVESEFGFHVIVRTK